MPDDRTGQGDASASHVGVPGTAGPANGTGNGQGTPAPSHIALSDHAPAEAPDQQKTGPVLGERATVPAMAEPQHPGPPDAPTVEPKNGAGLGTAAPSHADPTDVADLARALDMVAGGGRPASVDVHADAHFVILPGATPAQGPGADPLILQGAASPAGWPAVPAHSFTEDHSAGSLLHGDLRGAHGADPWIF